MGYLENEEDAVQVEAFFKGKNVSAFKRGLDGALESIRLKATEYGRDREAVAAWLTQNV